MMNQFCLMIFSSFLLLSHFMPVAAFVGFTKEHGAVNLETYVNEDTKFTLQYPSNWMKMDDMGLIDLMLLSPGKISSPSSANMNVLSENLENSYTLEEVYSEVVAHFTAQNINFKSGEVDINGIPSKWMLYDYSMNGVEFPTLQYLIVHQNKMYTLTYGGVEDDFNLYYSDFEKIVSSFRLL